MDEENRNIITFSGVTPTQICEQYARGEISIARVKRELFLFPYVPGGTTNGYDSLIVDPPGTWSEVADARRHGLITDTIYEDVFYFRQAAKEGTLQACRMVTERPYPFGMCEVHDESFPLGEVCPFYMGTDDTMPFDIAQTSDTV